MNVNNPPDELLVPTDDIAFQHLEGMRFPAVSLETTSGIDVDISSIQGFVIIFFYPHIGKLNSSPMPGWAEIPGAKGCTPQSCAFRDLFSEFYELGSTVFGVSSQSRFDQIEASERLHLPFELISDSTFQLGYELNLPTFRYNSSVYFKRLTLIIKNGIIKKVFYPVTPPEENAANAVAWLKTNQW